MTVAPYSRLKKAKDLLRETANPLTDFDYDLHIYRRIVPRLRRMTTR